MPRRIVPKPAPQRKSHHLTALTYVERWLRSHPLPVGQQLLALKIAGYMNRDDWCQVLQATLAKSMGLDDRSVRRHQNGLEECGLFAINRRRQQKKSSEFTLIRTVAAHKSDRTNLTGQNCPVELDKFVRWKKGSLKKDQNQDPLPSLSHDDQAAAPLERNADDEIDLSSVFQEPEGQERAGSGKPEGRRGRRPRLPGTTADIVAFTPAPSEADRLRTLFAERCPGHPSAAPSKLIAATLRQFTLDQLDTVFSFAEADDYYAGRDPKSAAWYRNGGAPLKWLLRNAADVLARATRPQTPTRRDGAWQYASPPAPADTWEQIRERVKPKLAHSSEAIRLEGAKVIAESQGQIIIATHYAGPLKAHHDEQIQAAAQEFRPGLEVVILTPEEAAERRAG